MTSTCGNWRAAASTGERWEPVRSPAERPLGEAAALEGALHRSPHAETPFRSRHPLATPGACVAGPKELMKLNQIWTLGTLLLAFGASCKPQQVSPPIPSTGGADGSPGGAPGTAATGGSPGAGGAAGAGEEPKELVCQEGTDPSVPAPTFDPDCPSLAPATVEICVQYGLLFATGQRMCVKPEDCVPPLQRDGDLCKGSGIESTPGCTAPTPIRRCWSGTTVCWCSAT
jgi:hypothetical protein